MSARDAVVQLHDLDLLIEELRAARPPGRQRAATPDAVQLPAVQRARAQLVLRLERRWLSTYERARQRYGRGVTAVRDRVCQGCYITLPTAAAPAGDALTVCESCGRILYWL